MCIMDYCCFFVDAKLAAFRRIFLAAAPITIAIAAFFECPKRSHSGWLCDVAPMDPFCRRCSAKYRMAETDLSAPLPQASRMRQHTLL